MSGLQRKVTKNFEKHEIKSEVAIEKAHQGIVWKVIKLNEN
jgi:hypothetical protein